jgi:hypothetical protein
VVTLETAAAEFPLKVENRRNPSNKNVMKQRSRESERERKRMRERRNK